MSYTLVMTEVKEIGQARRIFLQIYATY